MVLHEMGKSLPFLHTKLVRGQTHRTAYNGRRKKGSNDRPNCISLLIRNECRCNEMSLTKKVRRRKVTRIIFVAELREGRRVHTTTVVRKYLCAYLRRMERAPRKQNS